MKTDNNKVFIVHGHNIEVKETVARTIEKLGLEAVILNERPNTGQTIIEKLENNSDVGFAIILLTPDDLGKAKSEDDYKYRARQNVLVEMGYFIAKLGREKVCPIFLEEVELPSDFDGILYVPYDASGSWKFILGRELKAAGYNIDLNDIA
ncbi:TIR domain-containing protein [Halothermothrix orenii]|uniref:TIR domain-containing protein n=1 Tax=Halothermothrix orenii TaxID=31909 RepID=UPI00006B2589|nr:nucleotide-binding protein [Halothermothrix orenii]